MSISIEKAKAFLEEKERKRQEMLDVLYDIIIVLITIGIVWIIWENNL